VTDGIELVAVVAVAENGIIGRDGEMPWHYPADLRHFRRTTTGHPVLMGRVTYETVAPDHDGGLPDRTNVVLTRSGLDDPPESVVEAGSVDEALAAAVATGADVAYVVGGASVYEALLPRIDRVLLTRIPGEPEGDTSFSWDEAEWTAVDHESLTDDLEVVTHERVR